MAPTFSIRELLWFSLKLANFPEIWSTDYRGDKRFKFSLLVCASERAGGW